jgi:uncharacterized protein (DUF4415 family)
MRIADRIKKVGEATSLPKKPPVEELKRKVEEIQARPPKSPRKAKPPAEKDQAVTGKRKAGRPASGNAKEKINIRLDQDVIDGFKANDRGYGG